MGRPRLHLREEPLDPVTPLKAAAQRREAVINRRRAVAMRRTIARGAEALVLLLEAANVGTPKPLPVPVIPQPIRRDVFQSRPMRPVRDWRSLPLPDLPRPVPMTKQPTPTLYGTRYRSSILS
jgi:hypothetical protein